MMSKKKYSDNEFVTRAYNTSFEVSEEERGLIIGTPIVFGQETRMVDMFGDEFIEIISPTALQNTDLRDVVLLANHNETMIPLARSKNGNENSTMKFEIDENGFHIRAMLDIDNNSVSRALYSSVDRGDMDGMSFAMRVRGDEWRNIDSNVPTRIVTDISIVHEVSIVNFPAYPQTSVSTRSGNPYSPLKEIRGRAEETALIELERHRNINLLNLY